jgi:hypothetical protein
MHAKRLRAGHAAPSPLQLTLKDVDSLGCVGGMQGLQRLCLESCRRVTDLSPLAQLPSLHTLLLRSIRALSDLQPLAQVRECSGPAAWRPCGAWVSRAAHS